jgi:hypothetical protein
VHVCVFLCFKVTIRELLRFMENIKWYAWANKWPQDENALLCTEAWTIYAKRFSESTQKLLCDDVLVKKMQWNPPEDSSPLLSLSDGQVRMEPGDFEVQQAKVPDVILPEMPGWDISSIEAQVTSAHLNVMKLVSTERFIAAHGLIEIDVDWLNFWIESAKKNQWLNNPTNVAFLGASQYMGRFRFIYDIM